MAEVNGRHEAESALVGEVVTAEAAPGEVAQDTPPETDPNSPGFITPKARTMIYITSLIVWAATGLLTGIALIVGWINGDQAEQIIALVSGTITTINVPLAVGFRPTRPQLTVGK